MAARDSVRGVMDSIQALIGFAASQNSEPVEIAPREHEDKVIASDSVIWEKMLRECPDDARKMIRFPAETFEMICELVKPVFHHPGCSGKQSNMSYKDQIFMTLYFLAQYPTLDALAFTFKRSQGMITDVIHRTLELIAPILRENFIRFIPLPVQQQHGWGLAAYPNVVGIGDASLINTNKSKQKPRSHYSGKHKLFGVKIQCITSCNGIVMDLVSMIPGSVHDFKIFQENQTYLLFTGHAWENGEHRDVKYQGLFDSGYQGAGRLMDALLPMRRLPHQELTAEQYNHNQELSSQRIIVENFFGRLKGCWKILAGKYRGQYSLLKDAIDVCVSLTNLLVVKYPLRGEKPEHAVQIIADDRDINWAEAEDLYGVPLRRPLPDPPPEEGAAADAQLGEGADEQRVIPESVLEQSRSVSPENRSLAQFYAHPPQIMIQRARNVPIRYREEPSSPPRRARRV